MRTFSQIGTWLFAVALLAGGRSSGYAVEVGTGAIPLAITSMATQEDSLVLTASIPPGLKRVTLETRSALDAPWEEVEQTNTPAGGGELTFVFPQSSDVARFFRLRGNPAVPAAAGIK
ncbi:MAG: hypothetical protein ACLQVY_03030 [Limisphaerales bacterium]